MMYQGCVRGKGRIISLILIIIVISTNDLTANNTHKNKLSFAEFIWAIQHPFLISKAKKATDKALDITDSIEENGTFSGRSGGNLDAFKHAYWMALLVQNMKPKKALKLGKAHEKNNYRLFKKGKSSSDKIASDMDLYNNLIGRQIIQNNPKLNNIELVGVIINAVRKGDMKVIKKDSKGKSLDCQGQLIDKIDMKTWENKRCLVPSDYQKN